MIKKTIIIFQLLVLQIITVVGQEKFTLSGSIIDKTSGEDLIGATVIEEATSKGTITNVYGFFSFTIPEGKHTIKFSYVGYESIVLNVDLLDIMER